MEKEKNKVLKKTIQLIIVAFLAKGLGFIREMVLANYYGTSYVSDVFVAVQNIPAVIFTVFGTAVTTGFIPLYTEIHTKKGQAEADKFANNVFYIFLILSIILSCLGIIFSKQLVYIFAGGFSGETYELCNNFTKIVIPTSIPIILVYVYNAYLQINGFFNQNSLMNVPYNIMLIISIVLGFYTGNNYILAIGLLMASFSQFLYLQVLIKRKTKFKHIKYLKLNDKIIWNMLVLVGPMFISTGINQINVIVDRSLASRLVEGSVSALNYSNEIVSIVTQVIILSLTTILYPTMTKLFSIGNKDEEGKFVEKYIIIVALLVFPLSALIFIFSKEIVAILFGRGAFSKETVIFVSNALKIYSIGIIGASFRDVMNKIFYSMKNTITPMVNGIISVCVNIFLNFILIEKFKYLGLAFSTSFSSIICTILMSIQLLKKMKSINIKKIIFEFIKIMISTIIMVVFFLGFNKVFTIENEIIMCVVEGVFLTAIYIVNLLLLKEECLWETWKNNRLALKKNN